MPIHAIGYSGGVLSLGTQPTNQLTLQAGETYVIPSGDFIVTPGPYTTVQVKDPVSGVWINTAQTPNAPLMINSDGATIRLANLTGCVIGCLITNGGADYTSAPTVTFSAGSAVATAILGGAVSTTTTISAGGTGYTYPPTAQISVPPGVGVAAKAIATLSGTAVSALTITEQGAGYGTTAPTVTFVNDARDTTGAGAAATLTIAAGQTQVTGIVINNHGTPLTAVPTIAFSGGGGTTASATAIMEFGVTGFTISAVGGNYGASTGFGIITMGGVVAGTAAYTSTIKKVLQPRQAVIQGTTTSGGAVTTASAVVVDAGLFQAVPAALVLAGGGSVATTQAAVTMTVGGVQDQLTIQPFLG